MTMPAPRIWLVIAALIVIAGGVVYWWTRPDPGDARLNGFVHAKPPVPVVFTSRSEPESLVAAAPEGEGFTEPGQRLWAAREGRLRLLTPRGTVHELTWNKPLPDGDTIIDVMSPSISLDGKRILFAGRKATGHGRFRLYEIAIDGTGLRQLTGGPNDEGCSALPPLRWRCDGSVLSDAERRQTDYDDVDPIELNYTDHRIVFVSSRTPDLGRDHARRSTTLWVLHADGSKLPVTGNRNNDRWPYLLSSKYIAFSLWSRNREVVSADLRDIRPYEAGKLSATQPTDAWLGAFTQMPGGHFGMLVKPDMPVWRPRPLFVNRMAFMTTLEDNALTVVQTPPGMVRHAPSAQRTESSLPRSEGVLVRRGPNRDADGRPLWLATPSPCPTAHILLSGATIHGNAKTPKPGDYGLYLASDKWPEGIARADAIDLKLLFDDPEMVDAEPVAVYPRHIDLHDPAREPVSRATPPGELALMNGQPYRGSMGNLLATAVDAPTRMGDLPGQQTDAGSAPIFDDPPPGSLDHLRIYAARRDRFDDPHKPRIPGEWDWILKVPIRGGAGASWVPTDAPTVLAGFGSDGRIVQWSTNARDLQGRRATFYAYAGDHYSLAQPLGKHFCVGCHPGHSGLPPVAHDHAERLK